MAPIVSTIDIARPPEEVFAYVTDISRFTEWQKDVVSVHPQGGSRFTTTRRVGGTERTMTQQITASTPPRSWAVRGVDGPIRPSMTVTVEPVAGGSRVTFALDFEAHGIGVALVPGIRRLARRGAPVSYRNLKNMLERGDRPAIR